MRRHCIILSGFLLALPLLSTAQSFDPKTFVPKSLVKYSFGMSLDAFTQANTSAAPQNSFVAFRTEYQQKKPEAGIKHVTYYFDDDNNRPLYEMIITFTDVKSLDDYCSKKLGHPDNDKQWKRATKQGYTFKAWRFDSTLVLALGLPGTEWENEWDN